MRARGNTMLEGKIIIIAAAINAILDPIMIFGLLGFPRLEMAGAAWATLTANLLVFSGTLIYLHFGLRVFATPFTKFSNVLKSWQLMLHVGLPAMLTNAIVPLANGIIVALLAGYGVDAVAGFGVGIRIEPIALITFYALSAISSPFMGQNFAANRFERLDEARRAIARFAVAYGVILSVALLFLAAPLTALFSETETIQRVANEYLWIMVVSYAGYGIVMSVCASFNGIGYPLPGVAISVSRAFVLFVPLAFLGQKLIGMNGIFVAAAISNLVLGVAAYTWFGRHIRRQAASHAAGHQT
jgi:Na+-driven multidrug efflux pump